MPEWVMQAIVGVLTVVAIYITLRKGVITESVCRRCKEGVNQRFIDGDARMDRIEGSIDHIKDVDMPEIREKVTFVAIKAGYEPKDTK